MNKRRIILNILTAVFVLMLAFGGYKVVRYIQDKNASDHIIEEMAMDAVTVRETVSEEMTAAQNSIEATETKRQEPSEEIHPEQESTKEELTSAPVFVDQESVDDANPESESESTGKKPTPSPYEAEVERSSKLRPRLTALKVESAIGIIRKEASVSKTAITDDPNIAVHQTAKPQKQFKQILQAPIEVNFEKLKRSNPDIVGWLFCKNVINEPVVQGTDNIFYMSHAPNKSSNINGSVFMDCTLEKDFSDANLLMYGHNMISGARFGMLVNYKKQGYYEDHQVMYFITPEGDYAIELMAGLVTTPDSEYYTQPEDDEDMSRRMTRAKERSTFNSPVEFEDGDTIVTMSTCSYETNNARYVMIGRLVPLYPKDKIKAS